MARRRKDAYFTRMDDQPKKRRRRFKQTLSLGERLQAAAELARKRAEGASEIGLRQLLLRKALAAENVAALERSLAVTASPQRPPARRSGPRRNNH